MLTSRERAVGQIANYLPHSVVPYLLAYMSP